MEDKDATPQPVTGEALLERLAVIEDQPLDQRAQAFARIQDELQRVLDGGDASGAGA